MSDKQAKDRGMPPNLFGGGEVGVNNGEDKP
jgi:hypothetical protein